VSIVVMIAAAATLHLLRRTPAGDMVPMADVLKPLAHGYADHVLALALFGAASLALPPLAGSAAQAVASSFERGRGERRDSLLALSVVALMALGVATAVGLALYRIEPVKALYWSALVNGMTVTPVLVLLVLLSSRREAVGDLAAHWSLRVLSWVATGATAALLVAHVILEFV